MGIEAQLDQLESERFPLMRPIDQAFARYEQSDRAFGDYLPVLVGGLSNVALVQPE